MIPIIWQPTPAPGRYPIHPLPQGGCDDPTETKDFQELGK